MRRLTKREITQQPMTLAELYQWTDEALADLPKPPCAARKCNGCCWSPPTITDSEFEYLQKNVQIANMTPAAEPWCRFYEESSGGCRVYSYRPLECRLVAVLDTQRFSCCAPAAQPEPMPAWAPLLRELLYRVLNQIDGRPGEVHINTRFDHALRKMAGAASAAPPSKNPVRTRFSHLLLGLSFQLVRIARKLTVPPAVGEAQPSETKSGGGSQL